MRECKYTMKIADPKEINAASNPAWDADGKRLVLTCLIQLEGKSVWVTRELYTDRWAIKDWGMSDRDPIGEGVLKVLFEVMKREVKGELRSCGELDEFGTYQYSAVDHPHQDDQPPFKPETISLGEGPYAVELAR